jgi:peptide/nickel transport system permease protein
MDRKTDIDFQPSSGVFAKTPDSLGDRESLLAYTWYVFRSNPLAWIGSFVLLSSALLAVLAPVITPYGPTEIIASDRLQSPSRTHPMGTDHLGMDIFSRVVFGARVDLVIAVSAVLLAMVVGVPLGAIIGYSPPRVDEVVMRIIDGLNAFPSFFLALLVAAALGPGIMNVIGVVAFANFSGYLRLVRGQVLSLKERQFVEAARCVGNPPVRIIFGHLLPNTMAPVLVLACLNAAWAMLTAAGLSFVGVGVPLPTPEWGLMVNSGARYVPSGEWWISFFPGLAICLVVLGFNFVGDSFRDILDPRRRFR